MNTPEYNPPPDAENAALLVAIDRDARHQDWTSRQQLYKAYLESTMLLPLVDLPAGVRCGDAIPKPVELPFAADAKPNGEKWIVLFTDEGALREWDTVSPFVRIHARTAFKLMLSSGLDLIYVNLFREQPIRPGGLLTKHEFEILAAGIIPERRGDHHVEMTVDKHWHVDLGLPQAPLSIEIIGALSAAAVSLPSLIEIRHFRMSINNGPPHDALGLVCRRGLFQMSPGKIAERLLSEVQPLIGEGRSLDVIPYDRWEQADLEKGNILWRRS